MAVQDIKFDAILQVDVSPTSNNRRRFLKGEEMCTQARTWTKKLNHRRSAIWFKKQVKVSNSAQ